MASIGQRRGHTWRSWTKSALRERDRESKRKTHKHTHTQPNGKSFPVFVVRLDATSPATFRSVTDAKATTAGWKPRKINWSSIGTEVGEIINCTASSVRDRTVHGRAKSAHNAHKRTDETSVPAPAKSAPYLRHSLTRPFYSGDNITHGGHVAPVSTPNRHMTLTMTWECAWFS